MCGVYTLVYVRVCVREPVCVCPQLQIEQGQCVMQHRVIDSLTHRHGTHTLTHTASLIYLARW